MYELKLENKERYKIIGEEIPEDKFQSQTEFQEFEYFIIDKMGTNLFPNRKFKAISREIDDEYYWLYFNELVNNNNPITLFTNVHLTPFWVQERLDIEIVSFEREKYNDVLNIDYVIKNTQETIKTLHNNGIHDDIYGDVEKTGFWISDNVSIIVNGELNDSFSLDLFPGEIYDGTIKLKGDYVYSDISVEFILEEKNYTNINGVPYYPDPMKKEIILDTSVNDNYLIAFQNKIEHVTNIIYSGEETIVEDISFSKSFSSVYIVPETINDLFIMEYRIDGKLEDIILPQSIEAKIVMEGYNDNKIKIDIIHVSKGTYNFTINEPMYYDRYSETVEKGYSHGEFLDENGLIIPWDYSDNLGNITFSLSIKNYFPLTFKFDISFKNNYQLRGKEGKYYFAQEK